MPLSSVSRMCTARIQFVVHVFVFLISCPPLEERDSDRPRLANIQITHNCSRKQQNHGFDHSHRTKHKNSNSNKTTTARNLGRIWSLTSCLSLHVPDSELTCESWVNPSKLSIRNLSLSRGLPRGYRGISDTFTECFTTPVSLYRHAPNFAER